jgi:hypothetical protein
VKITPPTGETVARSHRGAGKPYAHSRGIAVVAIRQRRAAVSEKPKNDLKDLGDHTMHGVEDVADVVGHGIGGTVKGLADGVEAASAETQVRETDE